MSHVPFTDAKPGDTALVYRCTPGDEYGWVTDKEWFDDIDDPVTTVRQVWRLVSEETVTFHPSTELCPMCHGEEEITVKRVIGRKIEENVAPCPTCKNDPGRHPHAGQMTVETP